MLSIQCIVLSDELTDLAEMHNHPKVTKSKRFAAEQKEREEYVAMVEKKLGRKWIEPQEKLENKENPYWVENGICAGSRRIISRCRQYAYVRRQEDLWNFAPQ